MRLDIKKTAGAALLVAAGYLGVDTVVVTDAERKAAVDNELFSAYNSAVGTCEKDDFAYWTFQTAIFYRNSGQYDEALESIEKALNEAQLCE